MGGDIPWSESVVDKVGDAQCGPFSYSWALSPNMDTLQPMALRLCGPCLSFPDQTSGRHRLGLRMSVRRTGTSGPNHVSGWVDAEEDARRAGSGIFGLVFGTVPYDPIYIYIIYIYIYMINDFCLR